MSNKRIGLASVYLLLLAAVGPATCAGKTQIVGAAGVPCPGAMYSTISAALSAAAPGDVIDICPATYPEQLLITKPVALNGLSVLGVDRVLIQPSTLTQLGGLPFKAVITVMNTSAVGINNLVIDASANTVEGCSPGLASVHFVNASGEVSNSVMTGARLSYPASCNSLLPGNGFGVRIEATQAAGYSVSLSHNSIHDFTRDGVLATGPGLTVDIDGNSISGNGPAQGVFQFGVFVANGAGGKIRNNLINEGNCGALSVTACVNQRSEGVVLRAAADATSVDNNMISNAQAGVFLNGGNGYRIRKNIIRNIDAIAGILMQGAATGSLTATLVEGNTITNVGPISQDCYDNGDCFGIMEVPGTGLAGNTIVNNTISDAFYGIGYVNADHALNNTYFNTLYPELNLDHYTTLPPAFEPARDAAKLMSVADRLHSPVVRALD